MIKKIDIMMPSYSQYEVQHHFTRKVYEAFIRRGLTCRLLEEQDRFLVPIKDPPDLLFGFNGLIKTDPQHFLCDVIHVPYVIGLLDPLMYFFGVLMSPYAILACDDKSSCTFAQSLGFTRALFMPHAVEADLSYDLKQERIYDITFLGSFIDCEQHRKKWKDHFSSEIYKAMDEAISVTLSDETTPFLMALMRSLYTHLGLPFCENKIFTQPLFQTVFKEVELYIKGKERIDLINAISADKTVHLFGNTTAGWKNCFQQKPNVIIHPAVGFTEALEIMKKSKIVINSSIKNKHGAHERIFTAAACGAVVVTNDNVFLREHLVPNQDIILYRRSSFSDMNASIDQLLNEETKRQAMSEASRAKVMQFHTWDQRVDKLLADVEPLIEKMRTKA